MNKKKICIVAPIHIWDDVRVFKKQAVSLANLGYEVTVIARTKQNHNQDGVKILKSKISDNGKVGRIFFCYRVLFQALSCKADIYHLHNPNTIPIALSLSLLGKKIIYDTHEDFSQRLLFREWLPNILRKPACLLVSFLERVTAKNAEASIATQESVKLRLGVNSHLIGNAPRYSEELINTVSKSAERLDVDNYVFRLVYLGSINESRGITDIINSLVIMNESSNVRLWLMGDIDKEYESVIENLPGWRFVDYLGKLKQETAFAYVKLSNVGLIYIHDIGDHSKTDPNKLYEYMTFNIPFIATSFPDWESKLSHLNAGLFIEPKNISLLSKTVLSLESNRDTLQVMGNNGHEYVVQNNWNSEIIKLKRVYSEILG